MNVNINGVVKSLLIPVSDNQAAASPTTKTTTGQPLTTAAKSVNITPTQQVMKLIPTAGGQKLVTIMPSWAKAGAIRSSTPSGNHVMLQVPVSAGGSDKFKYVFVQQGEPLKRRSSTQPVVVGPVGAGAGLLKTAQNNLSSVLNKQLLTGKTPTVVYPGMNRANTVSSRSATYSLASNTSTPQLSSSLAANKVSDLNIGSVFSRNDITKSGADVRPNIPAGFIEIKPEPMDTGYESNPQPTSRRLKSPQTLSLLEHPVQQQTATTDSDFEVLAEWEAKSDDNTGSQSTDAKWAKKRCTITKPLGPRFAKKEALSKKARGIKYPKIAYAQRQRLGPVQYRIKRSTVDLERLEGLIDNFEQYIKGKTIRRAAAVERDVINRRVTRIRKEWKRRHIGKQDRIALQKSQAICSLAASCSTSSYSSSLSSVPGTVMHLPARPLLQSALQPAVPTTKYKQNVTASGPNMSFSLTSPTTQTVSVDKKKYLMVKTAAGSFLVPVSPGTGPATKIAQCPSRPAPFQAVGPSMKIGQSPSVLVHTSPSPTILAPAMEEPQTQPAVTTLTTAPTESTLSVTTSTSPSEPKATGTSAEPEVQLTRAERIKLLKEKLKKQQKEMKSAHRLHEQSKNVLESIGEL